MSRCSNEIYFAVLKMQISNYMMIGGVLCLSRDLVIYWVTVLESEIIIILEVVSFEINWSCMSLRYIWR